MTRLHSLEDLFPALTKKSRFLDSPAIVVEDHANTMATNDDITSTITRLGTQLIQVPSLKVVVKQSDGTIYERPLGLDQEIVCGSSPSCAIQILNDSTVSRTHCEIRVTEKGIELTDLSKNGTFFGIVRITKGIIPLEAPIALGGATLIVRADGPPTLIPISSENYFGDFVSQDLRMRVDFQRLKENMGHSAGRRAPAHFLIVGEAGTGKKTLAKSIHLADSRKNGPCLSVECAEFTPERANIELRGYESGAFPGVVQERAGILEHAHGGTVVLAHIDHLPQETQMSIASIIEQQAIRRMGGSTARPIDIRIIGTIEPDKMDLLSKFLLPHFTRPFIKIPALRERKEDIPLLSDLFWARKFSEIQVPPFSQTHKDIIRYFRAYDWPYNVRELQQCIEGMSSTPTGAVHDWFNYIDGYADKWARYYSMSYKQLRDYIESFVKLQTSELYRAYILFHLEQNDDNIQKTADAIGVARQWLTEIMKKLDIPGPKNNGGGET